MRMCLYFVPKRVHVCMCVQEMNLLNNISQYYMNSFWERKILYNYQKLLFVKLFLTGELKILEQVILKNKVFTAAHISVEDEWV